MPVRSAPCNVSQLGKMNMATPQCMTTSLCQKDRQTEGQKGRMSVGTSGFFCGFKGIGGGGRWEERGRSRMLSYGDEKQQESFVLSPPLLQLLHLILPLPQPPATFSPKFSFSPQYPSISLTLKCSHTIPIFSHAFSLNPLLSVFASATSLHNPLPLSTSP